MCILLNRIFERFLIHGVLNCSSLSEGGDFLTGLRPLIVFKLESNKVFTLNCADARTSSQLASSNRSSLVYHFNYCSTMNPQMNFPDQRTQKNRMFQDQGKHYQEGTDNRLRTLS